MYEDRILSLMRSERRPLSIAEVRGMLEKECGARVSYETVKRDLMVLSAKGLIRSKSIGKGRRVTWVFWAPEEGSIKAEVQPLRLDPFKISIEERDSLSPLEISALYDQVFEEYGDLIRENLKKGSRYLVLCGGEIVYASGREPSDEEVRDIERRFGKVCYIFTEDVVEEFPWSTLGDEDYYPTIEVHLGGEDWGDDEVFRRGIRVSSDFDTGNPELAIFDHGDLISIQPRIRPFILRRALHLGRIYDYYLLGLKVGIEDAVGARRCIKKICRGIPYWKEPERNPFLLVNPGRKGFLGRDLMLNFPFSITLSGRKRRSRVLLE